MFQKTAIFGHFGQIRPFPVAESDQWKSESESVKRKGTSPCQDLSYEPIPMFLRPSVTKIQPGKESMTDRRTDTPNL